MRKKKASEGKVAKRKRLLMEVQNILNQKHLQNRSLNEVILYLAESFFNDIRLSEKQRKKIEEASVASKMSQEQILDKACDWASKFYQKKYQQLTSKPEASQPGSAYWRIDTFVRKLMNQNDKSKRKEDKIFINQTYLEKNQGSNRSAIKGYLDVNKDVLDKHHKKHSLHSRHNIEVNAFFNRRTRKK